MVEIVITLILLAVGYGAGSVAERKHYASIKQREKRFIHLPTISLREASALGNITDSWLVIGGTVVSVDYFKRFAAALRSFFGGRISTYESLIDRARREAVLRMKENASGASMIINVRLETSSIGGEASSQGAITSVEAIAYGTALRFADKP